ncbi:hypothetical protein KC19_11G162600 [Ceratodon purpureus]|uniref:AB hydrolase-1 domain-containing protein n=1 Tax=Ceratodon purpureus TaxID=3225 RepID=A0A8T0GGY2_CERPU|nr:hypothetical protein KC19_11G162600 [Ceratodon purpureus]
MELHHFVLVHGGMHGAWQWYKLVDRLQKAGHKVTALDMAGAGTHPASPDSIATFEEYNKPVTDFFQSLPEDDHQKVVLIGHSLGGVSCLQFMESFSHKIGLAILVTAVLTPSGASVIDSGPLTALMFQDSPSSRAIEYNFGEGPDKPPTSWCISKPLMKEIMYDDWDSEDAVLATILCRPFPGRVLGSPITYTKEKHGQVPAVYIKYLRDNTMPVAAQNWIVGNLGPFKEVLEVDASHLGYWQKIDEFTQLVFRLTDNYFVK